MVSLWGSKKNDGIQNGEEHSEPVPQPPEVDERTRLLPPPPRRDRFLSPDDPAVSPYNLWSVRFLRCLTWLLLVITSIWWVLLLISTFVTPPGMHSRGSGFFAFSYTTLTLGILLIILLFFSSPSKAAQVTCLVLAVLLLLDAIIIASVPQIRFEEGWVGIASVTWALFTTIWTVMADRVVEWGKREEEERLTGREETRRTLREWFSIMTSTIVLILLAIVVMLLSATLILRANDSSLDAPGELYFADDDKFRIHLFCEGNTTNEHGKSLPTVLFEAGERPFEGTMREFATGVLNGGAISRYCYSDRSGFAWSDNAPSPFSAGMAVDALSEALVKAGEQGPWVLASAGVGSIYSRIFSSRHGRDITGILLIDPLHEDLLYRLATPRRGFLLWARGVVSPLGIGRLSGALFKGRTREDRVYGHDVHQDEKYIKAKLQESLVADTLTRSEVISARNIQDKKIPLAIVSSGVEMRDETWAIKQRDLSYLTNRLIAWDVVDKSSHEVWETYEGRQAMERRLGQLVYG